MKNRGFTLLEVIIIIAIIGIFSCIFIPIGGYFIRPSSYKITHRHNDGTTSIYITSHYPTNDGGKINLYTKDNRIISLSGDIVIEEIVNEKK